ncbi:MULTISPECIES: helix-turn-helix domain-containing protein [Caulobacter]|jgi:AraC-like DNA-binding protein|uniref:DNA-binding domain-containing protein, AraC-type n=1 Tax=Caulobacter vibrioides OR37 TaxID=1292034 RepID=R0E519_CAUVI|nr:MULTISPECIES: helix-turn-helix domain-containing protein [Caulobacter]ENZ80663.1 DNA-binding domain-containing protein, AraC-type [Caulobacter vibrioides OR37]MBQ1560876.1 AraC family transcriptional regulator [Caulobacter sp.]
MDLSQLDVITRVAGATLLLSLAALLARDPRTRRLAAYFAPMALCLAGFLAGNTPDAALRLGGVLGHASALIAGYAAVFLWWFCLASFDPTFRPRGAVLAAGLLWLAVASADRGLLGPALESRGLSWILIALGLAMIGYLFWLLVRDHSGDLVDERRRARVLVVVLLAGQLGADFLVDLVMGMDWNPRGFTILQNTVLLAFSAWLALRLLPVPVPASAAAPAIPPAQGGEARLTERLRTLVEIEKVHLEPDLTFADFARRMGAPERTVRQLINHRLGHDHFRAFLNARRVAEAKRLLADPARAGDKLIAIALDSGFSSLASFNRAFQAVEGQPPSAFRAAPSPEERSVVF